MNHEIKRATGLLVLEAVNSNPNGDPTAMAEPRQRDNGRGEISPVSFKRKLRDLIEQNDKDEHDTPFFKALPEKFSGKEHEKQYLILEHRGRNRSQIKEEMRENSLQSGRRKFVERYWTPVFSAIPSSKKGKTTSSEPASYNLEWAFPLRRSRSSGRQIPIRPVWRAARTGAWRRWHIVLWTMGYIACRFLSIRIKQRKAAARRMILNCSSCLSRTPMSRTALRSGRMSGSVMHGTLSTKSILGSCRSICCWRR